jgi:hypothetical protein
MKNSFSILITVKCAVMVLLLSPVLSFAQDGLEALGLQGLTAKAKQLSERLDKSPSDYNVLRELGRVRYYMAVKDSKSYVKEAVQSLERALQTKPDDDGVLCYLGSAYLMMARDESDPTAQMSYLGKGLGNMDEAVRRSPNDTNIRMIRGYTTLAMPVFLNRRPTAYEDFEYIAALIEKGNRIQPSMKTIVYNTLAGMYKTDGDPEKASKFLVLAVKAGE